MGAGIHAIRKQRTCRPGKRRKKPSPFVLSGGLLVCSHCGANFAGRNKHSAQIYRDGADCDAPWYVRREDAENAAFDCIQKVLSSDSKHTARTVNAYNKWVDSQLALYGSTDKSRRVEIERLQSEVENLTHSLASGVNPATISAAINERVQHIEKLSALADVELPKKITAKELDAQAAEVRRIAENCPPDQRRSILRKYIAAMEAIAEERTIRVMIRPLPTLCGHWLVAPKPCGVSAYCYEFTVSAVWRDKGWVDC